MFAHGQGSIFENSIKLFRPLLNKSHEGPSEAGLSGNGTFPFFLRFGVFLRSLIEPIRVFILIYSAGKTTTPKRLLFQHLDCSQIGPLSIPLFNPFGHRQAIS